MIRSTGHWGIMMLFGHLKSEAMRVACGAVATLSGAASEVSTVLGPTAPE